MAQRHRKSKALDVGDFMLQVALIISLLRTDFSQYLTNFSYYPEVRQALLGYSVGLQVVDNSHHAGPAYPVKYIDDTDYILSGLTQFARNTYVAQNISAYLVTENSSSPLQVVSQASRPNNVTADLSNQEINLIELLWKQNTSLLESEHMGAGANTTAATVSPDFSDSLLWEDSMKEIVTPPLPFKYDTSDQEYPISADDTGLLPAEPLPSSSYQLLPPFYQPQNSLDLDLDDLPPYTTNQSGSQITNSSLTEPFYPEYTTPDYLNQPLSTNNTGLFYGNTQPVVPYGELDNMSLLNDTIHIEPSLMDDLDVDPIDADLDINDLLPELNIRDSVSEDSAISAGGSSPSYRSWTDRISESGSDEVGAVGGYYDDDIVYKQEPLCDDDDEFLDLDLPPVEPVCEKGRVRHDHTYSAPPGGVPHVRKMDIKVPKEPSRGLARDELMCRKLKIPFSVDTIIDSPMDEFNSLLRKYPLSTRQVNLVRDIRRRGKNKVAAQNCRQKKIGEVSELELEVDALRSKRDDLNHQKSLLVSQTADIRKHIDIMSTEIFRTLRDENGVPYNTSQVTLEVGANGEITVTPANRSTRRKQRGKKRHQR